MRGINTIQHGQQGDAAQTGKCEISIAGKEAVPCRDTHALGYS
jgi:hypothetical protein